MNMDSIMTFLENNYLWLIVVGVILLFALIGYAAEKTKTASDKKVKAAPLEKEDIKEPEVFTEEEPMVTNFNDEVEAPVAEDMFAVNEENLFTDEPVISLDEEESETNSFDPLEEVTENNSEEDLFAPIGEELTFDSINKEEDLFAPIEDVTPAMEPSFDEEETFEEVSPFDAKPEMSPFEDIIEEPIMEEPVTEEKEVAVAPVDDIFKLDEEDEEFL